MLILPVNSSVEGGKLSWQFICLLHSITDILKGNLIVPITFVGNERLVFRKGDGGDYRVIAGFGKKSPQ
ncbi:MAG: hypothetical protein A2Y62_16650 [Candidatus Fischerbacteria bacterium RBG_13_37_8]|uniref:Uncharacterized protein n=1 Tax=Candidatus Fischerbacteria bacterium RBG_13_37_8 TaxID=1817863 RepID=A0A1F5VNS1_9BACT|nr:MAG: hypothetical protein A2Y62_16650 [Candidatus Fischerbacteria bacterium RBG_13_37_8]